LPAVLTLHRLIPALGRRWTWIRPAYRRKVFGIGLPKTGTTTLGVALRQLGYKHHSYDMELAAAFVRDGDATAVLERARRHESFEDWPWHLAFRELDRAFPGSRFILTRRRDTASYVDSMRRHRQRFGQMAPTTIPEPSWWSALFPEPYGSFDAEAHAAIYDAHHRAVVDHFRQRPADLLQVCWEEGDDWEQLCAFLKHSVPSRPFPHANAG